MAIAFAALTAAASPAESGLSPGAARTAPPARSGAAVRLLFAGDVMLGRGVARVAASDPAGLFSGIRLEVASADLAVANLESPLTSRPPDPPSGPNALEAPAAAAGRLAEAGFD